MVDLKAQYLEIREDIDARLQKVLMETQFIQGHEVKELEEKLADFLNVKHVISCGNGTDAIQLALMALDLEPGSEIITPAFSYIACVEMIKLCGHKPVLVDVEPHNFNINTKQIEGLINSHTKAIIPVHLFGQCCNMDEIMHIARKHNLFVIEDAAQSIGAYHSGDNEHRYSGTIGDIGTTSFFPSKNLGCYGDGGAIFTNQDKLAARIRQMASHGQSKKYYHDSIGINSRLDTLQAAVLNAKLPHLEKYNKHRIESAKLYTRHLEAIEHLECPVFRDDNSHVFHQYTIKLTNGKRDELKAYLDEKNISTAIYYPLPIHFQNAYSEDFISTSHIAESEQLSRQVLSLPIHSHIKAEQIEYICNHISIFMNI